MDKAKINDIEVFLHANRVPKNKVSEKAGVTDQAVYMWFAGKLDSEKIEKAAFAVVEERKAQGKYYELKEA